MPNIQMYGFDKPWESSLLIAEKMRKVGLGEEVVITIITNSHANSCVEAMPSSPYLRICATDINEIRKVGFALREMKIGVDVETLLLHSFVPADEMK